MKISAGILVYKENRVFLVHPGGPFYKNKKQWFIPKGEVHDNEDHWQAAVREWQEETGDTIRNSNRIDLGETTSSHKRNHIFAVEQDAQWIGSNSFEMTCPNGKTAEFPETDAGKWFSLDDAIDVLPKTQTEFITRLRRHLGAD